MTAEVAVSGRGFGVIAFDVSKFVYDAPLVLRAIGVERRAFHPGSRESAATARTIASLTTCSTSGSTARPF